ncbi:hypothetical protein [Ponticaulis sp.]|nr:hypothetical protein [Ponticaulis sp.]
MTGGIGEAMAEGMGHKAADLPSGFARLPEPLCGVRRIRHNFP